MSTFYTELMRGLGASSRLWELIERKPLISTEGKNFISEIINGNVISFFLEVCSILIAV